MKLLFWRNDKPKPQSESIFVAAPPQPKSYVNLINEYIQRNVPSDLEETFSKQRPFVFASLTAWPMFWVFRGLDWGQMRRRPVERNLIRYINRSYYQAKVIQIGIISLGFITASYNHEAVMDFLDPYKDIRSRKKNNQAQTFQQNTP